MYLDSENRMLLGVCSGLANWLDVPATVVRIILVLCALSWPFTLIGYVVLYFCLDRDFTPDRIRDYFSKAPAARYFRRIDYRKAIHRNARDKRIAGVCAGIADYLEISHFSVRLVTVLSLFPFGPFTFWVYLLCWFLLDPDPLADDGGRRHRVLRKRQSRAQKREARQQRRQARRQARARRKSYRNQEFAADSADPADGINPDLEQEIDAAVNAPNDSECGSAGSGRESAATARTQAECIRLYANLEMRLREMEAFMTSKKFRLHCEINRI